MATIKLSAAEGQEAHLVLDTAEAEWAAAALQLEITAKDAPAMAI